MRFFSLFMLLAAASVALALPASASQRYALVIGNDDYADVPKLELARADAAAVSDRLEALGFAVTRLLDGTRRETNRQIATFTAQLQPGDTAFLFYAGHGVEIDGENYLLPTDIPAPAAGERDFIKSESIALSALLDQIRGTGARTTIAIIDACRDNPFGSAGGRSIGRTRGLGRINAPEGMFVIFSAGAGQTALDRLSEADSGANSVFTRKLLPLLEKPDLELRPLMSELRTEVRELARTVHHDQTPAYYDELLGQFYFAAAPAPTPTTETADAAPTRASRIREDFELTRSVGTVEAYDAFLNRYAEDEDDFSVQLAAKLREKLLEREEGSPEATVKADPSPEVAEARTDQASRRDLVRQTQEHLNALGCNAGGADGIVGKRTRRAFARFMEASASELGADALGTQAGLAAVTAPGAAKCPVVAASQPVASGSGSDSGSDSGGDGTETASALTLAGTWSFTAKCALFVESKGTVRFRHVSGNFYTGSISDNLGNQGNSEAYLNGRDITSTDYFPGVTVQFRGRMSADGRSYTGSGTNTCQVYAAKH